MPAVKTTAYTAAAAHVASLPSLTTVCQSALTTAALSDQAVSVATGGFLSPAAVASLRLRNLWTYAECFTIANALGKTITYTLV